MKLTKDHLAYMNLGKRFWYAEVDNFTEAQHALMETYIRNLKTFLSSGMGAYIWGVNSSGKSYIAAALCKLVWQKYRVASYCVTAAELKDSWIQDREAHQGSEEMITERAEEVRFLVIDDLGREYRAASGFAETRFGALLRNRARARKTTVITSNLEPKEFAEIYGKAAGELAKECMHPFRLISENMRELAAKGVRQLMEGE